MSSRKINRFMDWLTKPNRKYWDENDFVQETFEIFMIYRIDVGSVTYLPTSNVQM